MPKPLGPVRVSPTYRLTCVGVCREIPNNYAHVMLTYKLPRAPLAQRVTQMSRHCVCAHATRKQPGLAHGIFNLGRSPRGGCNDGMTEPNNLLDGLDITIPDAAPNGAAGAGTTLSSGEFFGPYQLIHEVGSGGVARVLRARHIHPHYADTPFAVKILHEELSRDQNVVMLFRREAYVLAMVKHPNVVQTFEAGIQDDRLFIAMEYIDGRDLDNMLYRCTKAHLPLPLPILLHIVGEVLRALTYAHELHDYDGNRLNLIHRDVNPANVFISYDGRVKLGDFGVASITAGRVERSREVAGKVGYFAPEQLEGDPVDHRADLFAIGVMMFEMLCGERLFDADTADKAMRLNKRAKIPKPTKLNPTISPGLERVMLKALERKPQDRFASGRDMLQALQPFLPEATGMRLAVASLMRMVFLTEHIQELQMRDGLAGKSAHRGAGHIVHVFTQDARAKAAFKELLVSRGYSVTVCDSMEALRSAVAAGIPNAILADVSGDDFSPEAFMAALAGRSLQIPIVVASNTLDTDAIRHADALGAVDLLFKPFNIERVLTALRAAVTGHDSSRSKRAAPMAAQSQARARLLLVSTDAALVQTFTQTLQQFSYNVTVAATTADALQCVDQMSFDLVLYDAYPGHAGDRLFAGQYRARPGMGLVPLVYLVDPQARSMFRGMLIDRTAVRLRSEAPQAIVEVMDQLRADTSAGRTFMRYRTEFPAELRYGGRVFAGIAIDLSRGGVMLQCSQMPAVGTDVGVSLRFPFSTPVAEIIGRVLRVDLVKSERGAEAQVGIEFTTFAGRGEANLIAFIRMLDQGHAPNKTIILKPGEEPA